MTGSNDDEILGVEEAALLLGVSAKTFNKVLHSEDVPARKIGREWKFSKRALIDWVGAGSSTEYYSGGRAGDATPATDAPEAGAPTGSPSNSLSSNSAASNSGAAHGVPGERRGH